MIAKFRLAPGLAAAALMAVALPAGASNLLQNGGFEDHPAPGFGNNLAGTPGVDFGPWQAAALPLSAMHGQSGALLNLVKVDGPGGYSYGQGPESDASGAGAGVAQHYLSGQPEVIVWQNFHAPCDGTVKASAVVSSRYPPGGSAGGVFSTHADLGVVSVGPDLPMHPVADWSPASVAVAQLAADFVAGTSRVFHSVESGWKLMSFLAPVTAGQDYALVLRLEENTNADNVSVEYITECLTVTDAGSMAMDPTLGLPGGPGGGTGGGTGGGSGGGSGDSGNGTGGSGKPDDPGNPDLPEAKQIFLKKACEAPEAASQNGVAGVAWRCEVTVAAIPAPFAGSFSFTEDASAITGASGQIMAVSASPAWSCPGLPAAQTTCTIQGADFAASGVETLSFDLFAPASGPVAWKNCVNGIYAGREGKREVRGNCDGMEWKPEKPRDPKPEKASITKKCEGPREVLEGATLRALEWTCTVGVDVTPAPFAGSFAFLEDASQITGAPGTISNVVASPGWSCNPPAGPATPQMLCSINGADFSASGHEDLTFTLTADMTGTAGAPVEWENCVKGATNPASTPREVADCATMEWKPEKPRDPKPEQTSITKTCTEPTEQRHNGTLWGLGWECDVTVNVTPAPFAGSFSFTEDASGVIGASGAQIISVTAGPGWTCTPQPGSGQAQTACTIAGADFPASGQDVLHFELFADMANVPEQPVTWENCVSGATDPASTPPEVSDCVTTDWTPPAPPEPTLEVSKTCEDPVPAGDGWDVSCTVTVTGANLQPGLVVTVHDLLTASNGADVQSGTLSVPSALQGGVQCNIYNYAPTYVATNCPFSSDDLMGAGGTLSLPYTAHLVAGTGDSPEATNCASFQLHDSQGNSVPLPGIGVGSCVDLTLPDLPTATGGNGPDCGVDVLFVVDRSGSMNYFNRIAQVRAGVQMAQNAFAGGGSQGGLILFNHMPALAVAPPVTLPSPAIANTMAALQAGGATRWSLALDMANQVIGPLAEKPLVLFVTDGMPTEPVALSTGPVAAIRAQGSRIIGIGLGNGVNTAMMAGLLGGNVANVGNGDPIDPFTNDVILIPDQASMPAVFAQIAQAYCPAPVERDLGQVIDLRLPAVPYAGDDEPLQPAAPAIPPALEITKRATGPCRVDTAKRQLHCSFRIDVRNTGQSAYDGPLVVVDRPGSDPAPVAVRASGNGWQCDRQRGGEVTCLAPDLSLAPGGSAGFDLAVSLPGGTEPGIWQNCAAAGLPQGKSARVALAQRMMNARGLDAGPVDGAPGPRTYGALSRLRAQLGLPDSRAFDDRLFAALGLVASTPRDCAQVELQALPKPAPQLRCDPATTRPEDGACACSDPERMVRRSETQCACKNGLPAINGKCVQVQLPGAGEPGDSCKLRVNGICLSR